MVVRVALGVLAVWLLTFVVGRPMVRRHLATRLEEEHGAFAFVDEVSAWCPLVVTARGGFAIGGHGGGASSRDAYLWLFGPVFHLKRHASRVA